MLCGGWYWLVNSFWYCRSSLRPDVAAAFEHVSGCARRCMPTAAGKVNLRLGTRYERGGRALRAATEPVRIYHMSYRRWADWLRARYSLNVGKP